MPSSPRRPALRIPERPKGVPKALAIYLALVVMIASSGCTGSHSSVVATDASYPVSMSPLVRGPGGELLDRQQLEVVGVFELEYYSVHAFFGWVPLRRVRQDLSERIDERVAEVGGEAIVDFRVKAYGNGWNGISAMFGGVLPAFSRVRVYGTIVRRHPVPPSERGREGDAP